MRARSRRYLVIYFGAIGAIAGLASWLLILLLSPLFDTPKPSALALALAIPRGAIFGVVLALIVRAIMNRRPDKNS
jgi:membrane associated rhomboid family serine protease